MTAVKGNPDDLMSLVPPPAPAAPRAGGAPAAGAAAAGAGRGAAGSAPSLTVNSEKLGDGLYRFTTGAGSYDSLIVEFRDHIMMLEAGQSEARTISYITEAREAHP